MLAEEGARDAQQLRVGKEGREGLGVVDDAAQAGDAFDADAVSPGADGGQLRLGFCVPPALGRATTSSSDGIAAWDREAGAGIPPA